MDLADRKVTCPKCKGDGGEDGTALGDPGWLSCYFCGETGSVLVGCLDPFQIDAVVEAGELTPDEAAEAKRAFLELNPDWEAWVERENRILRNQHLAEQYGPNWRDVLDPGDDGDDQNDEPAVPPTAAKPAEPPADDDIPF